MGRARILVDAAPGRAERYWDQGLIIIRGIRRGPEVVKGSGMARAKALRRLTGGTLTVVSGREAYSQAERAAIFSCGRALTTDQVNSGDFEVAVVEW